MIGEVSLRKVIRLKRDVGPVMVYHVAPIAERLEKYPAMGGAMGSP